MKRFTYQQIEGDYKIVKEIIKGNGRLKEYKRDIFPIKR